MILENTIKNWQKPVENQIQNGAKNRRAPTSQKKLSGFSFNLALRIVSRQVSPRG